MAAVMKRVMVMVTRVAGNKTGNGDGNKSDDDGDKVGRQATASRVMALATVTRGQWRWRQGWRVTNRVRERAARAMETTMRVAGDKEGKGGKAMATATRVAGKWMAMATKRVMATKTRLGGAGGSNDQPLCTT